MTVSSGLHSSISLHSVNIISKFVAATSVALIFSTLTHFFTGTASRMDRIMMIASRNFILQEKMVFNKCDKRKNCGEEGIAFIYTDP